MNPLTEVLVTGGAEAGLLCCFLGLLDQGDEVILFDPSYDSYRAQIQIAGGVAKGVPLKPKQRQSRAHILKRATATGWASTVEDEWEVDW